MDADGAIGTRKEGDKQDIDRLAQKLVDLGLIETAPPDDEASAER